MTCCTITLLLLATNYLPDRSTIAMFEQIRYGNEVVTFIIKEKILKIHGS